MWSLGTFWPKSPHGIYCSLLSYLVVSNLVRIREHGEGPSTQSRDSLELEMPRNQRINVVPVHAYLDTFESAPSCCRVDVKIELFENAEVTASISYLSEHALGSFGTPESTFLSVCELRISHPFHMNGNVLENAPCVDIDLSYR